MCLLNKIKLDFSSIFFFQLDVPLYIYRVSKPVPRRNQQNTARYYDNPTRDQDSNQN